MPIKKYISDKEICLQSIIEGNETWEIKIADKSVQTEYAAYASEPKYRELKKAYLELFKTLFPNLKQAEQMPPFPEEYAYDFIDDLGQENFKNLGGYVVFFLNLRGENHLRHSQPIKKIEEIM